MAANRCCLYLPGGRAWRAHFTVAGFSHLVALGRAWRFPPDHLEPLIPPVNDLVCAAVVPCAFFTVPRPLVGQRCGISSLHSLCFLLFSIGEHSNRAVVRLLGICSCKLHLRRWLRRPCFYAPLLRTSCSLPFWAWFNIVLFVRVLTCAPTTSHAT